MIMIKVSPGNTMFLVLNPAKKKGKKLLPAKRIRQYPGHLC
jgi:hypothetical protein